MGGGVPGPGRTHLQRLKAAGAIPIGHTNLANLGVRWHCVSELWGATINPWDRSRTPGASSGGDAAALATGMTPLGVGGRWARIDALAGPMLRNQRAQAHPGPHPHCNHHRAGR